MQKLFIYFIFFTIICCNQDKKKPSLSKTLLEIKQKAANKVEFNCPVPSNDEDGRIEIGQQVRICIHIIPLNVKTIFTLKSDKKQVISLQNSYFLAGYMDQDYLIQYQNSDIFSNLIPYVRVLKNNINKAYPVVSIVINVQDGKIINIDVESLEEACDDYEYPKATTGFFYRFGEYKKAFCPVRCAYFERHATDDKYIDPQENFTYRQNCDYKILVTWIGTDKNKKAFMSGQRRFTSYRQFGLKQRLRGYLELANYDSKLDLNQYYQDSINQLDTEIQEKRKSTRVIVRLNDKVVQHDLENDKNEI